MPKRSWRKSNANGATALLPMIVMKRTLQQLLGGAPFIISGACGMFRTDVLRKFGFSDRTKVEDLDLTWTLVANGYRIRQANRCIVYPQECNSLREEWRRWRRWIVGYAVCMRLHKRLLFSRFGIFSIFPMLLVVIYGVGIYLTTWFNEFITTGPHGVVLAMFPLIWVGVVCVIGAFSAWFHRCWLLVPLAPLSVVYVLLAYAIWIIYGLIAFFTGREPQRDKPTRYSALVEASTAYSQPSVTGTEKLSEA
nr:glycosyltransferase family 2 protein [Escherichia coli]